VGAVEGLHYCVCVEEAREFSGVGPSESLPTAGDASKKRGPEEALEVEYGVEIAAAQASKQRKQGG